MDIGQWTWTLLTKCYYQIWYRAARVISQSATKCTYLQFMVLEGKDCDENAHEGGHGCCRQNGIVGFWVVHGHNCALSAPKHTYSQFMVARSEGFQ